MRSVRGLERPHHCNASCLFHCNVSCFFQPPASPRVVGMRASVKRGAFELLPRRVRPETSNATRTFTSPCVAVVVVQRFSNHMVNIVSSRLVVWARGRFCGAPCFALKPPRIACRVSLVTGMDPGGDVLVFRSCRQRRLVGRVVAGDAPSLVFCRRVGRSESRSTLTREKGGTLSFRPQTAVRFAGRLSNFMMRKLLCEFLS